MSIDFHSLCRSVTIALANPIFRYYTYFSQQRTSLTFRSLHRLNGMIIALDLNTGYQLRSGALYCISWG